MPGSAQVVSQTVGAFLPFMPNLADVRRAEPGTETSFDLRLGQGIGLVFSFVLAGMLASDAGEPDQVFRYWIVTAALLLALYEVALRDRRAVE